MVKVIGFPFPHVSNALSPMLVTPLPNVTLVNPLQPENAETPMLVTFGKEMLVKLMQYEKALLPTF